MTLAQPRLPLADLERFIGPFTIDLPTGERRSGTNDGHLAELCDVTRRSIHRWRTEGGIPEQRCDEIAVRLGVHPACIWPDYLDIEVAS